MPAALLFAALLLLDIVQRLIYDMRVRSKQRAFLLCSTPSTPSPSPVAVRVMPVPGATGGHDAAAPSCANT